MDRICTAVVTAGVSIFFAGAFVFCTITGNHDADVNKAQYVAAMITCKASNNVIACVQSVNASYHGSN